MDLKPGDKLGPYEILSLIGKGGMGEVWRARDPRLNRDVALKISAAQFSDRFAREARVAASLNHPNICTLHDVGPNYLVMELVEGPTLAERIGRTGKTSAIPLDEALPIAKQIAEALEAAHEKGVVHRDLKPANIKVKPDGKVKVLDFGLAKAAAEETPLSPDSPTMMSIPGMILGTAGYMAPEQARGKPVDKRADIFAYGVVVYEMVTGARLFHGETVSDILAAVIKEEPDWSRAPAQLQPLLRRCLEKDPKNRLRDIGDVGLLLDAPAPQPPAKRPLMSWMVTAALAAALVVIAAIHFREKPLVVAPISSTILPPDGAAFDFASQNNIPALSPDGKWIVFGAHTADNKNPLWLRPLASTTAQILAGTDGATFPFWSPDSRYVAFFAGGKLKKIDISGGPALAIADAPNNRGGSWSPEGIILFAPGANGPLLKVAASGGTPSPATSLAATKSRSHLFPWFLPDGRHFLFTVRVSAEDIVLRTGSLDSSESVVLGPTSSNALYSRGHLLFLRGDTLMAQLFDEKSQSLRGEAVPVAVQVSTASASGRPGVFTVSVSGLLAFQTGGSAGRKTLNWFDRGGKAVGTLGEPGNFFQLELSPDRKNVAVSAFDDTRNQDIWIYDTASGLRTRFTFDPEADRAPVWSPDGRTIVWYRRGQQLIRKAADGNGTEELLYEGTGVNFPTSWSPDGKSLLFDRVTPGMLAGVWSLTLTPEKPGSPQKPVPLLDTPFVEQDGMVSPDGHWVAYQSNESQQMEIYVIPFPGPGGKHRISTSGGHFVRWRRDGKEIYYSGLDGKLMAAEVTLKAGGIEVGQVRPLGITVPLGPDKPYDVSLDGQRILAITEPEHTASPPLTLVENWTALLKK